MAIGFPTLVNNAKLNALTTYAGSAALLKIYKGTRPATGGAASDLDLLAQLTFAGNIASAASGGVLTLIAPATQTSAAGTGTASWARIVKSDTTTVVMDMLVSATLGGGDLTLDSTEITAGGTVAITGGTITAGNL
jgi:hypothetical protein